MDTFFTYKRPIGNCPSLWRIIKTQMGTEVILFYGLRSNWEVTDMNIELIKTHVLLKEVPSEEAKDIELVIKEARLNEDIH